MTGVSEAEYKVLTALASSPAARPIPLLAEELSLDQSQVSAICLQRAQLGQLELEEEVQRTVRLGKKGQSYVESHFPDRLIIQALDALGGPADMPAVAAKAGLDAKEVGQSLRFLKTKDWVSQNGKELVLTDTGRAALTQKAADEVLVAFLFENGESSSTDQEAGLLLLAGRTGVVEERERTVRRARLTDDGRQLVSDGLEIRAQVTVLSSDMLLNGDWRKADLRPYDVTLTAQKVYPGKLHPLVSTFQETRKVFLELGFHETVSPYVESSFWDFDALFQPQDHPARDMQDTFYVGRPASCNLPDSALVDAVGRTHTDGGDTGSVGWRYPWNREITKRPVLRTHTTASTIRALAANPTGPRKVFCVGPVFRRETVDYKHLPVFHQVDGIIIDEQASFARLLGTLKAFYSKMGFKKFQFRPAFFPYTEPSVEIFVWSDKKGDWVEMGGAGMFRPEVTIPLGCTSPVLAWGLGLERLAMFRYELSSIGELYRARLGWLKEVPLCR